MAEPAQTTRPAPLRRDTGEVDATSPFARFITTLFGTM